MTSVYYIYSLSLLILPNVIKCVKGAAAHYFWGENIAERAAGGRFSKKASKITLKMNNHMDHKKAGKQIDNGRDSVTWTYDTECVEIR